MKKRHSLPIIALFFLIASSSIFLIWSHRQTSSLAYELKSTQPLVDETRARFSFEHGTRTILILGVDSLQSQPSTLVAVWLVNAQISNREVLLRGFAVDVSVPMQGQTLQQMFWYNPEGGVAPGFLEVMQRLGAYSSLDLVAVIDEVMFAALVDYVGGILVDDGRLSGQDAVAIQRLFYDDGSHLLQTQQKILDELRYQLIGFVGSLDITTLVHLSHEHAYLTVDPAELALWVAPFLPTDPKNIRVEIEPSTLQSHSAHIQP